MADERLKDLTRRFYEEVMNRGNVDVIDEMVAEDLIDHQPTAPGTPSGREGLRQWITSMRGAFPDLYFDIQDMTVDGDKVWVYTTVHGTNTGSFFGAPPTGKTIQTDAIDIMRVVNDKAVEHWGVFDQLTLLEQMGMTQSAGAQPG